MKNTTKFLSIRKKLISTTTSMVIGVVMIFLSIAIIGGSTLLINSFSKTQKTFEDDMISKGNLLTTSNSIGLRGLAEDMAFTQIRELVTSSVHSDKDIMYGIYMDNNRQPWTIVTENNPDGMIDKQNILFDSVSIWASKIRKSEYKIIHRDSLEIFEFASPIIVEEEYLGSIRYGFSTYKIKHYLAVTKKKYIISFSIMIIIQLIFSFLIIFTGSKIIRKQAKAITDPLEKLIDAASTISNGNYTTSVSITSNDEVGKLALNFEAMRKTIKEYIDSLEEKVKERTIQLEETQKEMVENAHKAGMADIATAVLHNVGNVLNSVMTSAHVLKEVVDDSKIVKLLLANELLNEHLEDIEQFITNDPKGKKLMQYYIVLGKEMQQENSSIKRHTERLNNKTNIIKDIIVSQQSFASVDAYSEKMSINSIIEEVVIIQNNSLEKYDITLSKDLQDTPLIKIQKTKAIHILINLIKNAKESLRESSSGKRILSITTQNTKNSVILKIIDNGPGIKKENLKKIFTHGFTTKVNGHGFGLHSCANYMTEMGGKIWAESDENGATFALEFPQINES